jgi:hypothetical protein
VTTTRAWRAAILPGISDRPEQLAEVVRAAREAGACRIWSNLSTSSPARGEHFLDNLARDWPGELERYERLYARRAYLRADRTKPLRAQVSTLARKHGIRDRRSVRLEPEPPVIAEQLALAV